VNLTLETSEAMVLCDPTMKNLRARLVCIFKQQFLVFLKIHVGEKVCNVI